MDSLIDAMYLADMAEMRPYFDKALECGGETVPEAPRVIREFFAGVESTPDWVDWDRIRVGQLVLQRGGKDGVYLARDVPFLAGFGASGINRTLLLTENGRRGESGNAQRFAETLQRYLDVVSDADALRPGGAGFRSTLHVRFIHAFVRRHVVNSSEWRKGEWGLPVNQTDMAATILGALFVPAVLSTALGILATPKELDDVAHLTRYVGWLMGVDDKYLPRSFRDAVRLLNNYLMALYAPDESTLAMAIPMAKDPLQWHYPKFRAVRRRVAWAQHLSITTAFIGVSRTRRLGIPAYMPPWYPAMRIPFNLLRTGVAAFIPALRRRQARAGLEKQYSFMRFLSGEHGDTSIGKSAKYLDSPAAGH